MVFGSASLWAAPKREGLSPLKVGFASGPDRQILEKVKSLAQARGKTVELIGFSSSQDSLKALADGRIDLSVSQHKIQLEDFTLENNFKLISLGNTYIAPLGFYSQTLKSLDEIGYGAKLVISDDPDKKSRALRLLARLGFIKINDEEEWPYKTEITENPSNLDIIKARVVRPYLNNGSIAAIALSVLTEDIKSLTEGRPALKTLGQEEANSPYVYVVAARPEGAKNGDCLDFVRDYQSQDTARFILKKFEGTIIPVYDFE